MSKKKEKGSETDEGENPFRVPIDKVVIMLVRNDSADCFGVAGVSKFEGYFFIFVEEENAGRVLLKKVDPSQIQILKK